MADSFVADLHVHSPYAFACSKALTLDNLALWARRKGIDLLATGDFTHPQWAAELNARLTPGSDGLYHYGSVRFVPGTEISCVYRQAGRVRRVHMLALTPTLQDAAALTKRLEQYGNLEADGRPTVQLSARELLAITRETSPDAVVIPAHVWTPWYGIYGSKSGFDSLNECFGDLAGLVTAVETGLSSDPAMNRAVGELDDRAIVSFSDAHSPAKLGREATAFRGPLSWDGLAVALSGNHGVAYTVEFHPEEGKYHYSGHRKCGVSYGTAELARRGPDCPVCGRKLTLGVLHRVTALADRPVPEEPAAEADGLIRTGNREPPFVRLVPLQEIIAAVRAVGVATKTVQREYLAITDALGSELNALLWAPAEDLVDAAGEAVAQAILQSRSGNVKVTPGFDGQYGSVALPPADRQLDDTPRLRGVQRRLLE